MGKVMAALKPKLAGRADMGAVSAGSRQSSRVGTEAAPSCRVIAAKPVARMSPRLRATASAGGRFDPSGLRAWAATALARPVIHLRLGEAAYNAWSPPVHPGSSHSGARRSLPRSVKSMIPNDFIQTLLGRGRHRRCRRPARAAEEGRGQLLGLLPVPQRKNALVHGEPDEAVLSLLRLRRPRHGHRLPDGVRRARRFPTPSKSSRATRRPEGARSRAPERQRSGASRRRICTAILLEAAQVLSRAAEGRRRARSTISRTAA